MTRRERLEARLEKRREWAAKREQRSSADFDRARSFTDGIPFGQPILVGHHSERRHRRALERSDNAMRSACDSADMAKHHETKAAGLADALDRSIFSDDPDALQALQAKVDAEEAECARKKAVNAAYRKGKGTEGWGDALGLSRALQATLASNVGRYSWVTAPFEAYEFSNARNRIRQAKERMKSVTVRAARQELAEAAPGGVVIEGKEWVRVTFADKPERSTIDALKGAGFRWGGGSWVGERAKLPEVVQS